MNSAFSSKRRSPRISRWRRDHLILSQPAVSLQIANLEKQLGLELFQRNGRSIVLSEAGKVLLPLAQEALRSVKHIEETMSGRKGVMIGELPIACSTTVGKYILPRLVAVFRRRYPDVRVTVHVMSRRTAVEWLLGGRAEIAVVSAKPIHSEVESASFLEDQVILIVPPDHPWADGRSVLPEDLLTIPFIMRETTAGTYEVVAEGLAAHGLNISQLQSVLSLANAEAIEMSVEAGIGAAFISRMAGGAGHRTGTGRGGSGAGNDAEPYYLYGASSTPGCHTAAAGILGMRVRSGQ